MVAAMFFFPCCALSFAASLILLGFRNLSFNFFSPAFADSRFSRVVSFAFTLNSYFSWNGFIWS